MNNVFDRGLRSSCYSCFQSRHRPLESQQSRSGIHATATAYLLQCKHSPLRQCQRRVVRWRARPCRHRAALTEVVLRYLVRLQSVAWAKAAATGCSMLNSQAASTAIEGIILVQPAYQNCNACKRGVPCTLKSPAATARPPLNCAPLTDDGQVEIALMATEHPAITDTCELCGRPLRVKPGRALKSLRTC
ncbi:unnamed protein product [Symbiodinium sp. CCMP2456]|nr:unnamed protein product [Symbiodinium sp. CCMP2456]